VPDGRTVRALHGIAYVPANTPAAIRTAVRELLRQLPSGADYVVQEKLGERVLDRIVITTGQQPYRREDGIAVIPLVLLARGPVAPGKSLDS
jgi:hypothetical protein